MIKFIIFILVAPPIVYAILQAIGESNGRKKSMNALDELIAEQGLQNYNWEQFDDGSIIVHDITYWRIWVIDNRGGWVGRSYDSISDIELIIDDSVEYKSSLSSVAGRAIIGGVLAGGVGAIIGGVTGKKQGKKVAHRVELILSYRTGSTMFSRIVLLDNPKGENTSSERFKEVYERGLHWSRLVSSLME